MRDETVQKRNSRIKATKAIDYLQRAKLALTTKDALILGAKIEEMQTYLMEKYK